VLLAGEGTYLSAYCIHSKRLLGTIRIFDSQAVHGIVVNDAITPAVVVYGGRLFRTIFVDHEGNGEIDLIPGPLHDVGDWILDATVTPTLNNSTRHYASIITAHNALYLAKLGDCRAPGANSQPSGTIECLVSRSNCILYSAHISWLSPSQCLIASGTAFGDIIVWSAFLSDIKGSITPQTQTHYTFSAHEGSIFGVQISPLLNLPGREKQSRVLASCSDDRNIKIWDISALPTESTTLVQMQRATGFEAVDRESQVAPPCLAKVMGHISRIWHVRFVTESSRGLRKTQSFGEDASIITWRVNPIAGQFGFTLDKLDVTVAHAGKNLWAVANDASGRLATGGADGAIALYSDVAGIESPVILPDIRINGSGSTDNIRAYGFIGTDCLMATTDHGGIVQIDFHQDQHQQKTTIIADPIKGLRGFSIVTVLPGVAFIAGADGNVYAYVHGSTTVHHTASGNGKPAGLFAYRFSDHEIALVRTTVGSSIAKYMLMEVDRGSSKLRATLEIELGLPPSFIVTSFASQMLCLRTHAILGSRTGSLAMYDLSQDDGLTSITYTRIYDLVHGKETITRLHTVVDRSPERGSWLLSTGRDGTFAIHGILFRNESPELELVHQLSLPFGPNIEGMSLFPKSSLYTWGFKSKHFIVYDIVNQREVMSVECGGAHRNWAFQPSEAGGMFIWTKASKVYRRIQSEMPYELLNAGGHGREIKAVAISPTEGQMIATGAEDTDIKLHRLEVGNFKCLQTLRKHNTGIQCLQWSADGRYLFSSGGFEEFFVWRISLGIPYLGLGIVCESGHPQSGTSDLRITGFDVRERMSDVDGVSGRHFTIIMTYSDSTTRLWSYGNDTWELLGSGDYLTACLTHAIWTHEADRQFITAATDGHLVQWRIGQTETTLWWADRHKVHQSATHAVTTRKLSDGSTIVVSGGDDNAIGITRIDCRSQNAAMKTLLLPRAHVAAVTGVVLVPVQADTYWLLSAGIDQRIKLWEVEIQSTQPGVDGIEVKPLQNVFTAVADVSSLDLCKLEDGSTGVLVSGVGMDMWRLPTLSKKS
jgi:WD40 repeat protein